MNRTTARQRLASVSWTITLGMRSMSLRILLLVVFACNGCGSYPTALQSARDIRRASADLERIRIGLLPINDYPLLSKFTRLKDIDFYTLDGSGADDEKLEALSRLKLEQLEQMSLLNCPAVSDEGIRHLSRIASLRGLQLEGTSIADEGVETIASQMRLNGVNLANCPKVTMNGLLKLATSESLKYVSFSADSLTQAEIVRLIQETKTISTYSILDREEKLDIQALISVAREKGISIGFRKTGAMQDLTTGVR